MAWRRIDVHRAVERGDLAVVTRYLDAGGDPEKKDAEYGAAPLHWASLRGRLEALTLLLDHGADLEARTGTDGTPLVWGCMGGDAQIVRHLLERGADIAAITKGKGTALHHATHSGHPEVVAMLLEKGADPKAQDNRGERPGDKFDPEVKESVRRDIAKTLAKAKGESSSARKSSKSKRSDKNRSGSVGAPTTRGEHDDGSLGKDHESNAANGGDSGHSPNGHASERRPNDSKGENGQPEQNDQREHRPKRANASVRAAAAAALAHGAPPQRPLPVAHDEDESLSAAEAAIAAAAWAPRLLKKQKSASFIASPSRSRAAAGLSRPLANRDAATSAPGAGTKGDNPAARAIATARDQSRSSTRGDERKHTDHADSFMSAPGRVADESVTAVATRLLRRELFSSPGKTPARASASEDDRELDDLRRKVQDLKVTAASAKARDSEARASLLHALDGANERAEDVGRAERARSDKLDALVQALELRLYDRDAEVSFLKSELEDRDARLRQREEEMGALRERVEGLSHGSSSREYLDRRPTGFSPPPTPPPPGDQGSLSRDSPRTRPSSTLSPGVDAFRGKTLLAGVDEEGVVRDKEVSPQLAGRRSTVGPGTGAVGEKSSAAGSGGRESSREGVLGWWKSGGWRQEAPVRGKKHPPPVVEDQERLGSLYSMIARR